MEETLAVFATGCSVLFEGDVRRSWLAGIDAEDNPGGWNIGPVVFTKRADNRSSGPEQITAVDRAERVGQGVARHTLGKGHRYHRRVSHVVRSGGASTERREMTIFAFELIVGDVQNVEISGAETASDTNDAWAPAVIVVHIDPPGETATSMEAPSALRFEHVGNLLARFFRFGSGGNGQLLQDLIMANEPECTVDNRGSGFVIDDDSPVPDSVASSEHRDPPVRLLASHDRRSTASFPVYWMFTDVAPEEDEDAERWAADIRFYEDDSGRGRPMGLAPCERLERRARRSRVLAELEVRPWAYLSTSEVPVGSNKDSALSWGNWDVTFSGSGAGFAHAAELSTSPTNRYRRDDLSTTYVDLVALEMLKDRVIQRFSELTRDLASGLRCGSDLREKCVDAWKTLVTFTSEYFGRTAGLELRDRDFLEAFRTGAGLDLEKDLSGVHANLERLAQASRMEIDEDISRRGLEREAAERRFNRLVGIVATIVIPLTVVPPLVEWFLPVPSAAAAIVGTLVILALVGTIFGLLWRLLRPSIGEPGSSED